MENETKNGLKLGGLISIVVGAISLIVIIPTISNIMKPRLNEYHIKFNINLACSFHYATSGFDDDYAPDIVLNVVDNEDFTLEYDKTSVIIKTIFIPTLFYLSPADLSFSTNAYIDFSNGYGLYDFMAINTTNIEEYMTLTPVYTPLYQ